MYMRIIVFVLLFFNLGGSGLPKASLSFWKESVDKKDIQKIKVESHKNEIPSNI